MRYRDKPSCQNWYERELSQAAERLEQLRNASHRVRPDRRADWERRLDDLRGLLNRSVARLEALRRASADNWRTAAAHADEAFTALAAALDRCDHSDQGGHSIAA